MNIFYSCLLFLPGVKAAAKAFFTVMLKDKHNYFMQLALKEARKAYDANEIPVGTVIIYEDQIIGKGYNQTELLKDVTAQNYLGAKFLNECTMYVTLEPCVMCAGAIYWARPSLLVYGARDEKKGFTKLEKPVLHPATSISQGTLESECGQLLSDFFKKLRRD